MRKCEKILLFGADYGWEYGSCASHVVH